MAGVSLAATGASRVGAAGRRECAGGGPVAAGQAQPAEQAEGVGEVSPPGGGREDDHDAQAGGQAPGGGAVVGRPAEQDPGRDRETSREQQGDGGPVPGRAGGGEQVPGQRAGGRGEVPGQAERIQDGVVQEDGGLREGRRGGRRDGGTRGQRRCGDETPGRRRPSRAAIITAITGTAGDAVIFMAHAIPIASAAPAGREGRIRCGTASPRRPAARGAAPRAAGPAPRHARARQNRPSTGGSVMPTASGSASTGVVTAKTARRSAS